MTSHATVTARWVVIVIGLSLVAATPAEAPDETPADAGEAAPAWAYPLNPEHSAAAPAGAAIRVPGSTARFSAAQLADLNRVADWHPEDHPPMPTIVARGRGSAVFACGYCHLADGRGRPENASLAGLPADYIVGQLRDMKAGRRASSVATRLPPAAMLALAANLTEAEMAAAADYFAGLTRRSMVDVVEAENVPVTRAAGWSLAIVSGAGVEPLGERIIEVAEDRVRFEHRDSHVRYRAYVPIGSVEHGERLALRGDGASLPACTSCHGTNLVGLAGRSPSYVVRQLHDFRSGARHGEDAAAMIDVARQLRSGQALALAAYFATLR